MPNEQIKPDMEAAREFLSALDPHATEFTFQTFDDNQDRKSGGLAQVLHGALEEHFETLSAFSSNGAGVFVTINETDLKGRKADNITRVRALWVDTDGAPHEPIVEHLKPHIVVESSPGNFHDYHLVDGCPKDAFKPAQQRLIDVFGTDKNVNDLPRVMRLPGFPHQKIRAAKGLTGKQFMVKMVDDTAFFGPSDWEALKAQIDALPNQTADEYAPPLSERAMPAPPRVATDSQPSREEVEEVISYISPNIGYRDWLTVLMGLHNLSQGYLELADEWSSRGSNYVPGEVASKWKSFTSNGGIGWGSVCKLAQDNGADLSQITKKYRAGASDNVSLSDFEDHSAGQTLASADKGFRLIRIGDLEFREPEYLLHPMLEADCMALIFGDPGCGKSFLALDLAARISLGAATNGR